MIRAGIFVLGLLSLCACAATAPGAVEKGYPAATLFHGALPQCRPSEDIGPCVSEPLIGQNAGKAFPDGATATLSAIRSGKRGTISSPETNP